MSPLDLHSTRILAEEMQSSGFTYLSQYLQNLALYWGTLLIAVKAMKQKTCVRAATQGAVLFGFSEGPPQPRLSREFPVKWYPALWARVALGLARHCRSLEVSLLALRASLGSVRSKFVTCWLILPGMTLTRAWITPQCHHLREACGFKWGLLFLYHH